MKAAKIAILVLIVMAAFYAGVWYRSKNSGEAVSASVGQKMLRYACPMHPQYTSDKAGDCPSCGMRLVPMEKDDSEDNPVANDGKELDPPALHISLAKQQLIGVRLATVERSSGTNTLRAVGRVAPDETRTYVINATVDGWITSTMPNSTGSFVRKNEVLATFFSPEFLAGVQSLLYGLSSMDRIQTTGKENPVQKDQIAQFNQTLQQYKAALRNLGMGARQIQQIADTRQFEEKVEITSPAEGFILTRKVSDGQRFNKGDELYRISDLSRVWILVDIFENEERHLRPGEIVKIYLPNQGTSVSARVTNILPQFDPITRTLKVRLEADNPGFRLRPDMFANVELPVHYPPTIAIPSVAVLDTGRSKTVFVSRGDGHFESRRVETGWRMGDLIEITNGLMPGEQIVVSGNFLIDSESRLRAAAMEPMPEPAGATDPVCGMQVDPAKAMDRKIAYQGRTYYFCSQYCMDKFQKDPSRRHYQIASESMK